MDWATYCIIVATIYKRKHPFSFLLIYIYIYTYKYCCICKMAHSVTLKTRTKEALLLMKLG